MSAEGESREVLQKKREVYAPGLLVGEGQVTEGRAERRSVRSASAAWSSEELLATYQWKAHSPGLSVTKRRATQEYGSRSRVSRLGQSRGWSASARGGDLSLRGKSYLMGLVALKDDETKLPLPESMIQKVWPYGPKTWKAQDFQLRSRKGQEGEGLTCRWNGCCPSSSELTMRSRT